MPGRENLLASEDISKNNCIHKTLMYGGAQSTSQYCNSVVVCGQGFMEDQYTGVHERSVQSVEANSKQGTQRTWTSNFL